MPAGRVKARVATAIDAARSVIAQLNSLGGPRPVLVPIRVSTEAEERRRALARIQASRG